MGFLLPGKTKDSEQSHSPTPGSRLSIIVVSRPREHETLCITMYPTPVTEPVGRNPKPTPTPTIQNFATRLVFADIDGDERNHLAVLRRCGHEPGGMGGMGAAGLGCLEYKKVNSTRECIDTHAYIYIYIYAYIHVYLYMYVYIYTRKLPETSGLYLTCSRSIHAGFVSEGKTTQVS